MTPFDGDSSVGKSIDEQSPFVDQRTLSLVLNTIALSGTACAVSVPIGTLLAWLLVRTNLPGRRTGRVVLALLLFVPLYLQAAAWQAGFGLQGWATAAGCAPVLLEGWWGAVWVHSVAAVPWVTLITGFGLVKVERDLEESAAIDCIGWQTFWHVTLPAALPAVGVATLWVALTTAGEMTVTDLFGVRTYAEEVYTLLAIGQEPGAAPLRALPGVAVTAALVLVGMVLCRSLAPGDRPLSLGSCRWNYQLGRWRLPASLTAAALLILLVGVPLGNLIYKAGVTVSQTPAGRVRAFSWGQCITMIFDAPWRCRREFAWSLLIGPLAAVAAVTVATPLAWLARRGGFRSLPALATTALALAVPGPILGLAIIEMLDRPELPWLADLYDHSILAPFLALTIRALPPTVLVLWYALRTVPQEMLDAAKVDGARAVTRLFLTVLPIRWQAFALALVVSLSVALADLAASILVAPPGMQTLSIHIFGLLHYGVEDQVAGVCLAILAIFAILSGVGWVIIWIMSRTKKSSPRARQNATLCGD
ncbi:MAG: ABC transporter permease subunit [Planctomycetaceae bacterium]|nr:ABC transporter permease subunit [Planctomycetaceae bacterium]